MAKKPDPADNMTEGEAEKIIGALMDDMHDDAPALARLCLLLRWLGYVADENTRQNLYIRAEMLAAPFMPGFDEAFREQRRIVLADIRKGGAK